MGAHVLLPTLYVEGKDDISVINALLLRHGVDTERGKRHLLIVEQENVETLLLNMPDAIKAATDRSVGFVVDIDVKITDRWKAVCGRLREVGINLRGRCPVTGFFGKLPDYPHRFGVWLMPDCATDYRKMEHLCETLIDAADPLWPHAQASVAEAAQLIDKANASIAEKARQWRRFRDVDLIKSQIHTWLAWQRTPGSPLGAAINDHILAHDSPQALAFLRWLGELYGFAELGGL